MAAPMILGMTASAVYSFTDTLFVSMLGDTAALAAVPMALPFSALVMALSSIFEVGAGTLVSRSIASVTRLLGCPFSAWLST